MKYLIYIFIFLTFTSCLTSKEVREKKLWKKIYPIALKNKWIDTNKTTTFGFEVLKGDSSKIEKEVKTNEDVKSSFEDNKKTTDTLINSVDSLEKETKAKGKDCWDDSSKYVKQIKVMSSKLKYTQNRLQQEINDKCLDDTGTVYSEDSLSWAKTYVKDKKRVLEHGVKDRKVKTITNNYNTNVKAPCIDNSVFYQDWWFYAFILALILFLISFFRKR